MDKGEKGGDDNKKEGLVVASGGRLVSVIIVTVGIVTVGIVAVGVVTVGVMAMGVVGVMVVPRLLKVSKAMLHNLRKIDSSGDKIPTITRKSQGRTRAERGISLSQLVPSTPVGPNQKEDSAKKESEGVSCLRRRKEMSHRCRDSGGGT